MSSLEKYVFRVSAHFFFFVGLFDLCVCARTVGEGEGAARIRHTYKAEKLDGELGVEEQTHLQGEPWVKRSTSGWDT